MENFLVLNSHGLRDESMFMYGNATIDLEHEKNNCYVFFTKRGLALDNKFAQILNILFYYNEDNINTELHQMCETLKEEYQRMLSSKSPSRILESDFSIKYSFRKDNIKLLENKMSGKIAEIFSDLVKNSLSGMTPEIYEKYKTKPLYLHIFFSDMYPMRQYTASDVAILFDFQLRFYFNKLPNTHLDFKLIYGTIVNKSGLYELSDYFKDNIFEYPLIDTDIISLFIDDQYRIIINGPSNESIIDYLYDKMFKNSKYLLKEDFQLNVISKLIDKGDHKELILDYLNLVNILDVLIKEEDVFTLQNRNYLMLICNSIDTFQIEDLPEFDEMLKVERQNSEAKQGLKFKGREGFNVPNAYYYKKYLKYKKKYLELKNK